MQMIRRHPACRTETHWQAPRVWAKPRRTGILAHRQGVGGSVYSGAIMLYYKDFSMKRLLTALIALVAITSLLAGCGQKGPLYLPDDGKTAKERDRDIFL